MGSLRWRFRRMGQTLASGSGDGTVRVWDAATGQEEHTLTGHTSRIESVAFSPDGSTLASAGSRDETVRLWDVATGQEKTHPHGTYVVCLVGGVFAGWIDTCKRQWRQYGAVVGSGNRAREKHPHRTYPWDPWGGVFAGWGDACKRRFGGYGAVVGRGHRGGKKHPHSR